jgi:hypothetical protein
MAGIVRVVPKAIFGQKWIGRWVSVGSKSKNGLKISKSERKGEIRPIMALIGSEIG